MNYQDQIDKCNADMEEALEWMNNQPMDIISIHIELAIKAYNESSIEVWNNIIQGRLDMD